MGVFKSGFVTLVGRTNVGKSTLLNALVKEKIAITANKVQTTRTAIKAIITQDNYQIIITDMETSTIKRNKLDYLLYLDEEEVASGHLSDIKKNVLYTSEINGNAKQKYKLYIWIDNNYKGNTKNISYEIKIKSR